MPTFNERHDCPGRCGRRVVRSKLACGPCWRLLPERLQRAVSEADADRRRHGSSTAHAIVHRRAVGDALGWYRAYTKEIAEGRAGGGPR